MQEEDGRAAATDARVHGRATSLEEMVGEPWKEVGHPAVLLGSRAARSSACG